jgi:hypothetical protein
MRAIDGPTFGNDPNPDSTGLSTRSARTLEFAKPRESPKMLKGDYLDLFT